MTPLVMRHHPDDAARPSPAPAPDRAPLAMASPVGADEFHPSPHSPHPRTTSGTVLPSVPPGAGRPPAPKCRPQIHQVSTKPSSFPQVRGLEPRAIIDQVTWNQRSFHSTPPRIGG